MRKASEVPHNNNMEFDKLIAAHEGGRLPNKLSRFFTSPVYQYTSQEIGGRDAAIAESIRRRKDKGL